MQTGLLARESAMLEKLHCVVQESLLVVICEHGTRLLLPARLQAPQCSVESLELCHGHRREVVQRPGEYRVNWCDHSYEADRLVVSREAVQFEAEDGLSLPPRRTNRQQWRRLVQPTTQFQFQVRLDDRPQIGIQLYGANRSAEQLGCLSEQVLMIGGKFTNSHSVPMVY